LGAIDVKKDDGVLKGQQIGTMASSSSGFTGLFTDIKFNVFFAVSVNNIFVNPVSVVENGIPGTDGIMLSGPSDSENETPEVSGEDE